ncbi:hypothetical protein L0663_01220 [Dyadobacter sp. CY107]|uniref:LIC_13387 family protein n=1 Tax=Dyadobacter fanqingshengii TaxID=2906443 RepID=UPI001F23A020|nr:hypothetical protein [Dyadobacter fanqingshengii]MCF2501984.1 hypothetical protein [Dyadobacter fanqingshengii]
MEKSINIHQVARTCLILASVILLFFGILHLHGTFFSTDLYPRDLDLIEKLKISTIQMDESGIIWKLWIGFNAMFSVGLIFIGSVNLYLSTKHFEFIRAKSAILTLTICSNIFFVWTGNRYMISDFSISMAIPLIFFAIGYAIIRLKRLNYLK